ncbi:MAG: hypothetical protein O2819_07610 [Planctomycetota bacterium]|nr:hypothetical protein [Planctomycetota bacterium]
MCLPCRDPSVSAGASRAAGSSSRLALAMATFVVAAFAPLERGALAQATDIERGRVERRIEQLGLDHLRIGQLESQLDGTGNPATKQPVAEELARLYLSALAADRLDLEGTSRDRMLRLMEVWDVGIENALALAIASRAYERGEAIAESGRTHTLTPEELAKAQEWLQLAERTSESARVLLEQARASLAKSAGTTTDARHRQELSEKLELVRPSLVEAQFRHAWSGYRLAWLAWDGLAEDARQREGEELVSRFARVLEIDSGHPRAADASIDLRGEPYYASALEGMALSQALIARSEQNAVMAASWVELLNHERTAAASRENAASLAVITAVDARDWQRVEKHLNESNAPAHAMECVLEASLAGGQGDPLGTQAALGAALGLMRDLAWRSIVRHGDGLRRLGDPAGSQGTTLAAALVDAAMALVAAEQSDGAPRRAAAWDAVAPLREILSTDHVSANQPLARSARAALGWALLESGRPAEAAPILAKAAEDDWSQAERFLWLAIVARERAAGDLALKDAELARLREQYQARFGAMGKGAAMLVRDSASRQPPELGFVSALSQVPAADSAWADSIRELSRIHYWHYRNARGDQRLVEARALLALPLPPVAEGRPGPEEILRRQLEVALDGAAGDPVTAARLLAVARELASRGLMAGAEAELACREVQVACAEGDLEAAAGRFGELDQREPSRAWRDLARTIYLRSIDSVVAGGGTLNGSVARVASQCARELLTDARGGDARATLRACELLLAVGDRDGLTDAAAAFDALPEADARAPATLLMRGRVSLALGNADHAKAAFTAAMTGARQGDLTWYEAKVQLVGVLEGSDPEAARSLLKQHKALDPSWGPEPAGSVLRDAARRLGVEAGS